MKAYHISIDIDNEIKTFKPQVPSAIYHSEDSKIPRICLSDSIGGCLSAVPWGGRKFEGVSSEFFSLFEDCNSEYDDEMFIVFRVYEFDLSNVPDANIAQTYDLLRNGLVMDANNSNELWVINQELTPTKTYLIALKGYTEEVGDVFDQSYYLLPENADNDIEFDDYCIGSSTILTDLDDDDYNSKKEIPFKMDWKEWKDILEELKENEFEMN